MNHRTVTYVLWFGVFLLSCHCQNYNSRGYQLRGVVPGPAPPCATVPGQTYCENVENYPNKLIQNALRRSKFNINKLFVDESRDPAPSFGPPNNYGKK